MLELEEMNQGPPCPMDCADPFSFAVTWYFHLGFSRNSPKTRVKLQIGFLGDIPRKQLWEDGKWHRTGREAGWCVIKPITTAGDCGFISQQVWEPASTWESAHWAGTRAAVWLRSYQVPTILGELCFCSTLILQHFSWPHLSPSPLKKSPKTPPGLQLGGLALELGKSAGFRY